jgi:PAS domain S-box-containing protein
MTPSKKIMSALSLKLVIWLVLGVVAYRSVKTLNETDRWVAHTNQVLKELDDLVTSLQDTQRGGRDYFVTGDDQYAAVYSAAADRVPRQIARVRTLTADNPDQQRRLATLEPAVAAALAALKEIIGTRRGQGFEAALRMVQTMEAEKSFEDARLVIRAMEQEEGELLRKREEAAKASSVRTILLIGFGGALGFVLLATAYVLAYHQVRAREKAQDELDRFFTQSLELLCIAGVDGRFKRLNPAWETTLGFSRQELLARPYMDFVHPDDREATRLGAEKVGQGATVVTFENRYRTKDGSYRWLLWNATPVLAQQSIYAVARDITDRKQAEEQVRQVSAKLTAANQALEQRNRDVESATKLKSQFLASMSHELRTPLNAIVGFSDLLKDELAGPLNAKQKRYVENVRTGAQHLLQLISDILDLSKIEANQLDLSQEDFSLTAVLPEVLSTIMPLALRKNLRLQNDVAANLAVHADRIRFKQILYNLLSNAVKFTPEGGEVRLAAEQQNGFVRVSVSDSGVGIHPADQELIFEEFRQVGETTKGVKEGTGLGLAITKRLVEQHGGRVSVESEPGKGSTFIFTLSASGPVPETAPEPPIAPPPQAARVRPLILVVDDDPASCELLATDMTSEGYQPVCVNSGVEAMSRARELRPDAITLDILMPDKGGWETLSELKSDPSTALIPIFVVSVVDQRKTGFALGATEYLIKPVSKEVLLRTLSKHLPPPTVLPSTILVVDDQVETLDLVSSVLKSEGYSPLTCGSAKESLEVLWRVRVDAILLDLLMPETDGFALLRHIKENPRLQQVPVFVLTAKDLTQADIELLTRETRGFFQKGNSWREELLAQIRRAVGQPSHPA